MNMYVLVSLIARREVGSRSEFRRSVSTHVQTRYLHLYIFSVQFAKVYCWCLFKYVFLTKLIIFPYVMYLGKLE